MTTAADLINLALTDSGVLGSGQTASTQDLSDSLRRLNMMIAQWSRRRWLVYHLIDTAAPCSGVQSYRVGPGGDFDIARPDRIEAAYIRQQTPSPTPVDWPLTQIDSREDYSRIALKTMVSPPGSFFYDSDYPYGRVYPWPLPSSAYELHILTKAVLQQFAAITDTVLLPPEYEEAIYTNLMVRERSAYRFKPDPVIIGLAKASLNTIRRSNFQVGKLRLPAIITNRVGLGASWAGGGSVSGGEPITTEDDTPLVS